ncbi:unnamed protein product, partial [Didymodactylos carnosus]
VPSPPPETDEAHNSRFSHMPLRFRLIRQLIRALWIYGYTPQSAVRLMGPFGPKPVQGYVTRRFLIGPAAAAAEEEAGIETGAAVMKKVDEDVYAYEPLQQRLTQIKRDIRVTFLYGDHDWMDVKAGEEVVKNIRQQGGKANLMRVRQAGHQLMIDNPQGFFDAIVNAVTNY